MQAAPGTARLLWRGLRRRCPACGGGPIFRSFLRLRRDCAACGWIVEREPGAVTGSMYLVSVLSLPFAAAVFFALWLGTGWPPALQAAVGAPLILLFNLWALPVSRSLWAAIEYATDVGSGEVAGAEYDARAFTPKGRERYRRGEAKEQSR